LDFSQDYHNITLSEVKTLENTLSHSQVFSIILGENARLDFFGKMGLRIIKVVTLKRWDIKPPNIGSPLLKLILLLLKLLKPHPQLLPKISLPQL